MKRLINCSAAAAIAAIPLLLGIGGSQAVTLTAGSDLDPLAPVFTVDPDGERTANPAARNVAADRNIRQTFVYGGPENLLVDDIRLSLNIPDGQTGGLEMRVWRIEDPNSSSISPLGNPLIDLVLADAATPVPSTGDYTQVQLDPNDPNERLVLIANRAYAIELSNNDGSTNFASWRHTNASPTDFYADGKFYTETGGQSGDGTRDAGWSINGQMTQIPEPASLLLLASGVSLCLLRRRS